MTKHRAALVLTLPEVGRRLGLRDGIEVTSAAFDFATQRLVLVIDGQPGDDDIPRWCDGDPLHVINISYVTKAP